MREIIKRIDELTISLHALIEKTERDAVLYRQSIVILQGAKRAVAGGDARTARRQLGRPTALFVPAQSGK